MTIRRGWLEGAEAGGAGWARLERAASEATRVAARVQHDLFTPRLPCGCVADKERLSGRSLPKDKPAGEPERGGAGARKATQGKRLRGAGIPGPATKK